MALHLYCEIYTKASGSCADSGNNPMSRKITYSSKRRCHHDSFWKILRRFASSSDAVGLSSGSGDQQITKTSHSLFHSSSIRRPLRLGNFERSSAVLSTRAAHRTVLRLRPYNLRPYFYKISRDPYRKVIFKKPDGTVRVKKRVYGRIYGFLSRHSKIK